MLSRLKIGQRLALGFGIILVMMMGVGLVAQSRVNAIARSLTTINDVNSAKQRFAINFRGSVHDRAINLRDVTLVSGAGELNETVATIKRLEDAYDKSSGPLDELMASGLGVTPDETAILASIKETQAKGLPMIADVIRLQKAGQAEAAKSLLMGEARPMFRVWLKQINQFIDLEEAKNKEIGAQARALASGFLWLNLAICVTALIVGVAIAVWSTLAVKPLSDLTGVMRKLASGDLAVTIPSLQRNDEVGEMAGAVKVFKDAGLENIQLVQANADARKLADGDRAAREVTAAEAAKTQAMVVESIAAGLDQLSQGNLLYRLTEAFPQEYEKLRADFNAAMTTLQDTMKMVSENALGIHTGVDEITSASDDLSRRTEQQAASLEETAAALDQITATVRRTAEGSRHAQAVVGSAKADAEHSGQIVEKAVGAMNGIEKSSLEITQIIGVIDEIAFQTNLLALNAGVEAARAGDAGRGFAVVASEVRALAQRSAGAAKEIKTLISSSGQQVQEGVKLVDETGRALGRIVRQVAEINGVVAEIAASAQEQASALNEVNSAINQMDQVTQQNAAMVEQSTAATRHLAEETDGLTKLMNKFQLGQARQRVAHTDGRKRQPRNAVPIQAMKTTGTGGAAKKASTLFAANTDSWEEF
ncbi:MAG: HAMP domain-containing methyl-accepting chemotaxis protein [Caulobacteraceae bacterium]